MRLRVQLLQIQNSSITPTSEKESGIENHMVTGYPAAAGAGAVAPVANETALKPL